ncbi:GNAT family N-acetyltransferase [Sporosarcina sp. Marseille-Q4063]|uniref:GNAT family N-acetyltransferase n=1 Tax=Sporosarcina sp. Marseille-Q4063 TaxID=2810514 RepID=UPI001BAEAD4F|nr:GNAT family N-acetyltransferase [Sporosarcina sp. Marseille-Q4063]QUW22815.1 GNAT family N-acetyltransferase [Sporosarcina sp. Marseille-Q4063]
MDLKIYKDANEFSLKVEPILIQKEDVNSLFLGVLQGIKSGLYENAFMATIEERDKVIAIFQMTPPHPLNLIFVDENRLEENMDLLIQNLMNLKIELPSIISLKPRAYRFAEKWEAETGMTTKLVMDQGLYRLDQVDDTLEKSPGIWRFAERKDCQLIGKWYYLFAEEAGLPILTTKEINDRVALMVSNQEVFLWEDDGEIVSMMKKSRPTKHGVTVSLVYTPKDKRRKGYARTLVAAISNELLKEFDFCVLYTDMMNPTSNKIYKEIGYKKIVDSVQLGFEQENGISISTEIEKTRN